MIQDAPKTTSVNAATLNASAIHSVDEGYLQDAVFLFLRACELDPDNRDYLKNWRIAAFNLAQGFQREGRHQDAIEILNQQRADFQECPELETLRAEIFSALYRHDEALWCLNRVIELHPHFLPALFQRANLLLHHGYAAVAEEDFALITHLEPRAAVGYQGLALAYWSQGKNDSAWQSIGQAVVLAPDADEYWGNHDEIGLDAGMGLQLIEQCTQKIQSDVPSVDQLVRLLCRRAHLYQSFRNLDAADEDARQALLLVPKWPEASKIMAEIMMLRGQWRASFQYMPPALHELTRRSLGTCGQEKLWQGQSLIGKRLLIQAEWGHGDMILYARFIALLAQQAAQVLVKVPGNLKRLFSLCLLGSSASTIQIIGLTEETDDVDYFCPMSLLLAALEVESDSVPFKAEPYMAVPADLATQWKERIDRILKERNGPTTLKVGIVWAGGEASYDQRRSLPLSAYQDFLGHPQILYVSLQVGRAVAQLAYPDYHHIADMSNELSDFADTAALINQLDLVISCDTAVAHLAGALGKPVWMLSRLDSPAFWGNDAPDNPWYQSLRMYCQKDRGDWWPPLKAIQEDLKKALLVGVIA
ncbi:glycosyltransferase family 9 protein [Herbaspirillum rubrisubalbicans]|uniref:Tetratricopeptide repeat protein n=1 Tax=Herbaspirillum rubrisubalbicans TaxID=80842 RepID=A0ABX9BU48_9BURK|nr:glycosyltransferase family 9 protein [Herbaspirillum rubrisubalbicans]RAM61243.1 hypothetical protein RB24_26195 [Herbaspirillum rubrisubalbicans]